MPLGPPKPKFVFKGYKEKSVRRHELADLIQDTGNRVYVGKDGVADPQGRTYAQMTVTTAWRQAAEGDKVAFKNIGDFGFGKPEIKEKRQLALLVFAEASRLGINPSDDPIFAAALSAIGYNAPAQLDAGRMGEADPEQVATDRGREENSEGGYVEGEVVA